MPSNKDYTELIEHYLDGDLSEKEQASFEQELASNPALRQELEFYRLAYTGIVQHKFSEVEKTLKEVKTEYVAGKKRQKVRNYVLASALVVLSGAGLLYVLTDKSSEKELGNTTELMIDSLQQEKTKDEGLLQPEKRDSIQVERTKELSGNEKEPIESPEKTVVSTEQKVVKDSVISTEEKQGIPIKEASVKTEAVKATVKKEEVPTKETKATPTSEQKDLCAGVTITAQTQITETCKGSEEGEIYMVNVHGGLSPYVYELSNGEKSSGERFTNLPAGEYTMYVTDHNGCKETLENIVIKEKFCKLNLHFDPSSGQPLVLPEYENAGQLSIFDKQGTQKFSDRIEANTAYEWFGNTNNGALAPGYYLLIIKFEDGTTQNGSITITP